MITTYGMIIFMTMFIIYIFSKNVKIHTFTVNVCILYL